MYTHANLITYNIVLQTFAKEFLSFKTHPNLLSISLFINFLNFHFISLSPLPLVYGITSFLTKSTSNKPKGQIDQQSWALQINKKIRVSSVFIKQVL